MNDVGVCCGICGGTVYMHACPEHGWTVISECHRCGEQYVVHPDGCPDCGWLWGNR